MPEALVVSFARTPVADAHRGSLVNTSIYELGETVTAAAVERSGIPTEAVDDLLLGEVLQGVPRPGRGAQSSLRQRTADRQRRRSLDPLRYGSGGRRPRCRVDDPGTADLPRLTDAIAVDDLDLVKINEAFASMAVACSRILGLPHEMVNVNGGAVGMGHPVAASGTRILGHLVMELQRRGAHLGVAALCAGGGMSNATVVEALP